MKRSRLKRPHRDLIRFITQKKILNIFGIREDYGEIFSSYFNEQITMEELAVRHHISRERVRQVVNLCSMKIRHYLFKAPHIKKIKETNAEVSKLKDRLNYFRNFIGNPFDTSIRELGINVRTYNALMSAKVERIGDLENINANDLLEIRNFGEKSLQDLRKALKDYGIKI